MTFAEWQAKYSGVQVRQPYPEASDVYMIQGRDPLNQGGGATFDAPLHALFSLTDYTVTSDNPHRGTVWIAPRVERDDWTRADYMRGRVSHEVYYYSLAKLIGLRPLERMVRQIAPDWDLLCRAFAGDDKHGNRIPLWKWDGYHGSVQSLISEQNKAKRIMDRSWCGQPLTPGTICWSLSESVCVLKAVARAMVERWQAEAAQAEGVQEAPK